MDHIIKKMIRLKEYILINLGFHDVFFSLDESSIEIDKFLRLNIMFRTDEGRYFLKKRSDL